MLTNSDTIIRRRQTYTGKRAQNVDTGSSFEEMEEMRLAEPGNDQNIDDGELFLR